MFLEKALNGRSLSSSGRQEVWPSNLSAVVAQSDERLGNRISLWADERKTANLRKRVTRLTRGTFQMLGIVKF